MILFFVVRAVRRMTPANRLPLWCLLAGLLALASSDGAYAYLTAAQGYEAGGVLDTGWFAGYLAIAVGAICSTAAQIATPDADFHEPSSAALVVPFVPILGALGVVALEPELVQQLDGVAFASASALVVLVLARQLLVIRDFTAPERLQPSVPAERHGSLR